MEILSRGNTAEVKKVKDGIVVLEVKRKIKYIDTDAVTNEINEDKDKDVIKETKFDDGNETSMPKRKIE
jgi:hypothetical protein